MLTPELKHHSASSINQFLEYRASWYLKVFKGQKTIPNENMARGTAVEEGINHFLVSKEEDEDAKIKQSIVAAHEKFVKETIGITVMPDFRATINGLVKAGIESVKTFSGEVIQLQRKIELKIDGIKLPIIGYIDWEYPNFIYDNKVTSKSPSDLKQGYILQGAVYRAALNKPVVFHFIIQNKSEVKIKAIPLSDQQFDYGMRLLKKAAQAIERIVDSYTDGDLLRAMMFPNPSGYWNDAETKAVLDEFQI